MDAHAITMKGSFYAENKSVAVYSSIDERKIRYISNKLYFGSAGSGAWIELLKASSSVPLGMTLLFESDEQLPGFNLLTTVDDEVVYITKGSGAGGEVGTSSKLLPMAGTWTQTTHLHSQSIHDHDIAHIHNFSGTTDPVSATTKSNPDNAGPLAFITHTHDFSAPTDTVSGSVSVNTPINTGAASTANTWRPKGRNFTLQERV